MIRPLLRSDDHEADRLFDLMVDMDYPHIDDHQDKLDYAIMFRCEYEDATAGYIWFYRLEEFHEKYVMHAIVKPEYQSRFFSRTLLTTAFNLLWAVGASNIVVEDDYGDLLIRVGGVETDLGVEIDLPFRWRSRHGRSSSQNY